MIATLYYVHDPMCSWCWAFRPVWQQVKQSLPEGIVVQELLGGLAPDSDAPMPLEMQSHLQAVWQRICSVVPGTQFNFEFWTSNTPRRSTYPACRAVIAAGRLDKELSEAMTLAIQQAYYLEARNPSDETVLTSLAVDLGLEADQFTRLLSAPATQQTLLDNIQQHQTLGARGFPSLVLQTPRGTTFIEHSYTDADATLAMIRTAL